MKITKEQIKEAYVRPELLKELFPDIFNILEIGKWYKFKQFLICVLDETHWFGFGYDGKWCEISEYFNLLNDKDFVPATHQEVEEALIKEAKKQHFTIENLHLIKCLCGFNKEVKDDRSNANYYYEYGHNKLWIVDGGFTDCCVFDNGKWAEIIEQSLELTLDQVSEKFNVKSVKIIK